MRRYAVGTLAAGVIAVLAAGGALGASAAGPTNKTLPAISGTPKPGQTLTASNGSWTGSGTISYAFRWQRCTSGGSCSDISGATTNKYVVLDGDAGSSLLIMVTATDSTGSTKQASVPVAVVGNAPQNTAAPTMTGAARVGLAQQAAAGTWKGTALTYAYQWRRCDGSGGGCADISGATGTSYTPVNEDLGRTLVVVVTASNTWGKVSASSAASPAIVLSGKSPAVVSPPGVAGTAQEGQTLTGDPGGWTTSGTLTFAFQWLRCDAAGANCATVAGATKTTYAVAAADVGRRLIVLVTATNEFGSTKASAPPTGVVLSLAGPGAIRLASGEMSVPVSSLSLPHRLILSRPVSKPVRITSRGKITVRLRVTDARGYAVRGALVLVQAVPNGVTGRAREVATGRDGWVRVVLTPTARLSLGRGTLLLFVRARKPGESPDGGISAARLAAIRVG